MVEQLREDTAKNNKAKKSFTKLMPTRTTCPTFTIERVEIVQYIYRTKANLPTPYLLIAGPPISPSRQYLVKYIDIIEITYMFSSSQ